MDRWSHFGPRFVSLFCKTGTCSRGPPHSGEPHAQRFLQRVSEFGAPFSYRILAWPLAAAEWVLHVEKSASFSFQF